VRVLVLNAGSSSLKVTLLEGSRELLVNSAPVEGGAIDEAALTDAIERAGEFDAVGHRVVHGGREFLAPVMIDDGAVERLRTLVPLAPLHQPLALETIDLARRIVPSRPHVACFDTAFHAGLPAAAATYALPGEWRRRWGLRRFGFHGLSHAYASRRAAELLGRDADDLRIVTCHLGAGASLAAVRGGVSIDTTMGFTPLEGLVMATRSGSVDPGLVLWLIREAGLEPAEVLDGLEHRSGLLALAGSADMRAVLQAGEGGDDDASLAIAIYVHHLTAGIAQMVASLGGLDVIVFTGGVGENAPRIRERAAAGLGYLGVVLDAERNRDSSPDAAINSPASPVSVLVVRAREDIEIVRGVLHALKAGEAGVNAVAHRFVWIGSPP
jgi:acetate kinase